MNVLLMTEILNKLSKSKYIFIGEQHGKKAITEKVFSIIKELEGKIIFCVELPQEVEDLLQKLLQKKITEKELFASPYLEDALHDIRYLLVLLNSTKSFTIKEYLSTVLRAMKDQLKKGIKTWQRDF